MTQTQWLHALRRSWSVASCNLRFGCVAVVLYVSLVVPPSFARDLHVVPLLDGDRNGLSNYWGGGFGTLNKSGISLETNIVHSGNAAYQADIGSLPASTLSFFQTFSSECTGNQVQRQTPAQH